MELSEAGKMGDANVETVTEIVKYLQLVVARFYGPQCFQTLLTSPTGQAVVTSDGLTILDTLQPSHPVAVIITKSVKNCLKFTQDGCKVYLLYLSTLLNNLSHHILKGDLNQKGTNISADKLICLKQGSLVAARTLHQFQQNVLSNILDKLYTHSSKLYTELSKTKSICDILQDVCKTTLAAHFNPKLCDYLSGLIIRFIGTERDSKTYHTHLRYILDHFGMLCIKVPNRPYTDSQILPSILLNRDFAVKRDKLLASQHLNVLLLRSCISDNAEADGPNTISLSVTSGCKLTETIHHRRVVAETFVRRCCTAQIDLVLCTESIPGYMLDMFRRQNISVVTYIQTEDMDLLEQLTDKLSVSFYDPITEQGIVTVEGVQRVGLAGSVYLHIKLPQDRVNQLVLYAPTRGLCDQVASVIQKALTCMMISVCPGFERELDKDRTTGGNTDLNNVENGSSQSRILQKIETQLGNELQLDKNSVHSNLNENGLSNLSLSTTSARHWPNIKATPECRFDVGPLSSKRSMLTGYETHVLNTNYSAKQIAESDNAPSKANLFVIEGGGGFEILLSQIMQDLSQNCKDENISLICKIIADSLTNVVRTLYDNVAISSSNRGFLEVRQELQGHLSEGTLWGLSRRGKPTDVKDRGVLEPVGCKVHIFVCVISLLQQLLQIDGIVSVRKLECTDD